MLLRSAEPANLPQFEGYLQQPHPETDDPPTPSRLQFSLPAGFIRWLLVGVFALLCYLALLVASGLNAAQGAAKMANTVEPVSPAAEEDQLAGERLFQTYTAWLQTSHAHAAVQGQDTPIPSQF